MSAMPRRAAIISSGAAVALAAARFAAKPALVQETESTSPDLIREHYMANDPAALGSNCLLIGLLLQHIALIPKLNNFSVITDFFGHKVSINKSNADKYQKLLAERQCICASTIEQRGYDSFAGTYAARANRACAEAGAAAYLTNINELSQDGSSTPGTVETVTQDRFRVTMTNKALVARNPNAMKTLGLVIERTLVLEDGLSPDFFYTGTRSGRDIVIRPMTNSIRRSFEGYPAWAPQPFWTALAGCAITLSPRAGP